MCSVAAMSIRERVCLPPVQLVLINISDHAMRISATSGGPSGEVRVLGCLLGQQAGRVVDISNSFELRHELTAGGSVMLDEAFVTKKLEQCKHTPRRPSHASSGLGLPVWGVLQTSRLLRTWTLWAGTLPALMCKGQTSICIGGCVATAGTPALCSLCSALALEQVHSGSQVMAMNESPVFLLMDIKPRLPQKELPVLLYESGAL